MIFPLRDSPRSSTWPLVVTWLLIAVNVVVFVWRARPRRSGQLDARRSRSSASSLGASSAGTQLGGAPLDPRRFVPLLTANFLHGGWLHIIGNMWFLVVFGDNVEDRLGHVRFLALLSAVRRLLDAGPGLRSLPGSQVPAIGASGAIAGVLGAYLVLYPGARVLTLVFFIFQSWSCRRWCSSASGSSPSC